MRGHLEFAFWCLLSIRYHVHWCSKVINWKHESDHHGHENQSRNLTLKVLSTSAMNCEYKSGKMRTPCSGGCKMIIVVRNRLLHTNVPHIHPLLETLFAGMSKLFSKILYTVCRIGLMKRLPCIRRPIWNDVFWLNSVGKKRNKEFLTRKAARIFTSGKQQPVRQVLALICDAALLLLFDLVDEMLSGCLRKGTPMSHKHKQQSKWWFLHSLHRQFDSFPSCAITKWKTILPIQFIIPIAPSPNFICALSWILNSGPCRHYSLILYLSVGKCIFNGCQGRSWSDGLLYLLHQSGMENFVQWKEWLKPKITFMHPL